MNERELKAIIIRKSEDDGAHEAWVRAMENSLNEERAALAVHVKASETMRHLGSKYKEDLSSVLGADLSTYRSFQQRKKGHIRSQAAREASDLIGSLGARVERIKLIQRDNS